MEEPRKRLVPDRPQRRIAPALALGAALALGGCSYVPDWANPVSWYDGLFDGAGGDALLPGDQPPAAETPAPVIADVPGEAPAALGAEDRAAVAEGLVADRAGAVYADDALRQGGGGEAPLPQVADAEAPPLSPVVAAEAEAAGAPPPLSPVVVAEAEAAQIPPAAAPDAAAPAPAPAPPALAQVQPAPAAAPAPAQQVAEAPALGEIPMPDLAVPVPDPQFRGGPQVNFGAAAPVPIPPQVPFAGQAPGAAAAAPAPPLPPPALLGAAPVPLPRAVPQALPPPAFAAAPAAAVAPPPAAAAPLPQISAVEVAAVLPPAQAAGQDVLAQVFAQMLAQSGRTVTVLTPLSGANPQMPFMAAADVALAPAPPLGNALGAPSSASDVVVGFAHDSAALTRQARASIREIADRYKAGGGRIHVIGHASSRTRNMPLGQHMLVNFNISVDRAQAVADELMRLGVAPSALTIDAVGDSQPRFGEAMPSGEEGNRRVEIYLEA